MITDCLKLFTQTLKDQGLHRERHCLDYHEGMHNFSSNDYLSLRNDARIKNAFAKGFVKYPAGSGASMLVSGYHAIHHELEQAFASQLNVDNALLFSSGFAANLGVVAMLSRLNCMLLVDKSIHASIYDGIKLSNASYKRYLHNNLADLQQKINAHSENQIILTEGIFSMSGQKAKLTEIISLCALKRVSCIVDEAHAFGVLGPNGLGLVAEYALSQEQVPLRIIPFGKAMGSQGAIVVGKEEWIDALLQTARSAIYSTAISPAIAYGLLESLSFVIAANDKRQILMEIVAYFQAQAKKSPLLWRDSSTPIQQLQLGCPKKALTYASLLKSQGIICLPMREPTVSRSETGLRVVLNAHHAHQDIDNLFNHLHCIYDSIH